MDEAEVDEVLYFRSTWDKLADNIDFHLVISEVLPPRVVLTYMYATDQIIVSLRRA